MPFTQARYPGIILCSTRLSLLFLVVAGTASTALAYGSQGHKAVAKVAQSMLSANASAGIASILRVKQLNGNELAELVTWPIELNLALNGDGSLVRDSEAAIFNRNFPDHVLWRFADLPLGAIDYNLTGQFSRNNDVVHMINHCINLLESPYEDPKFTRLQALRFLLHLVVSIHQPLHVATGYYRFSPGRSVVLVTDPTQAVGLQHDNGGQRLYYSSESQLHSLWDTILVQRVAESWDFERLATRIKIARSNRPFSYTQDLDTLGDYHSWAQSWAMQSVGEAREAYKGIKFFNPTISEGRIRRIKIKLPQYYIGKQVERTFIQLVRASYHLASLLNRIQWQTASSNSAARQRPPAVIGRGEGNNQPGKFRQTTQIRTGGGTQRSRASVPSGIYGRRPFIEGVH
jgi:hypothetical protein